MNKRIFIIHRWDGEPGDDWYPWLKRELENKGFEVIVPAMPDTERPTINAWVDRLIKVVGDVDENTYFVGHSVGCQAILRYLSTILDAHVGGVVLVAPWFNLKNVEDEESLQVAKPWIEIPIDFVKARNATPSLVAIFSDNDPYVDLRPNASIAERELGATITVESEKGHFTSEDGITELPELLKYF